MIYLLRVFNAIFRPRVLSRRITCKHPDEKSALIDIGRNKMFWCNECGYCGFTGAGSSA